MKIAIYKDELWPYFGHYETDGVNEAYNTVVDVDDDLLARIKAANAEFFEIQEILEELY